MTQNNEKTNDAPTRRRRNRRPRHSNRPKELPEIFFCGDPHGEFEQINEAVRLHKPSAVVILGDLQPPAPLEELLAEALALTDVWWIPGNHDTDTDEFYDRLWRGPLASHNLHGRIANIAGLRIGGLGGVFRGQVWMPDGTPNYFCPATFIRRVGTGNVWRGGLPRRHRSTIFPSVYQNLMRQRADVLVTHEAAGCHRKGFVAIDRLAKALNVKWHFHGHQHEDRVYGQHQNVTVRAVGYRGVVNLRGEVVIPAQMDPREAAALQTAIDWANRSAEAALIEVRDPKTGAMCVLPPSEATTPSMLAAAAAASSKLLAYPAGDVPSREHEAALGREVAKQAPGGRFKPWTSPKPKAGGKTASKDEDAKEPCASRRRHESARSKAKARKAEVGNAVKNDAKRDVTPLVKCDAKNVRPANAERAATNPNVAPSEGLVKPTSSHNAPSAKVRRPRRRKGRGKVKD